MFIQAVAKPAFDFVKTVAKPIFGLAETKTFAKFEMAFIIAYLILYSKGIIILLLTGGATEEGEGVTNWNFGILTLFWLFNYLVTAGLVVLRWDTLKEKLLSIICHNYFLWVFLMFVTLSIIWSEKPDETLKGSIGLFGTMLFGVYIVCRYQFKEQINILLMFLGIILVTSILFIGIPGYGIDYGKHAGAIRGVFSHKNHFGPMMTLSTATFLIYAKTKFCINQKLAYLCSAVSFALVVGSKSSSSLLYTILLVFLIYAIQILRFRGQLFAWSLVSLASLYFFIVTWQETLMNFGLGLIGKDPTLTGRTDIWDVILSKIQERVWLGYGFDGFWHGIYGESFYVRNAVRWDLPSAHNGFLDLALGLGIVGLALLMLTLWITLIKGLAILRTDFSWVHVWPVAFIFYTLMINMSESGLAAQNSIQTILLTIAIATTSIEFNKLFGPAAQLDD